MIIYGYSQLFLVYFFVTSPILLLVILNYFKLFYVTFGYFSLFHIKLFLVIVNYFGLFNVIYGNYK